MDLLVQLSPQLALLDVDLLHGIVHRRRSSVVYPKAFKRIVAGIFRRRSIRT